MKLSEAIQLGAMLAPQTFRRLRGVDGSTCALGAAEQAGFLLGVLEQMKIAGPWLVDCCCPECGGGVLDTMSIVTHLNDYHLWTREEVAAFVRSFCDVDDESSPRPRFVVDKSVAKASETEHSDSLVVA